MLLNQQENADELVNGQGTINASLRDIYKKLRPPLVSQKVYDDLSICIVFQMILFLANEHVISYLDEYLYHFNF